MQKRIIPIVPLLLAVILIACGGPPPGPDGQPPAPAEEPTTAAADPDPTDPPVAEELAEPTEDAAEAPTVNDPLTAVNFVDAWIINGSGATSPIFTGATVNVESVTTETINGVEYQCITASGIPGYETTVTQTLIDSLNSRPLASRDFANGETTLTLDDIVTFGSEIGYDPPMGCVSPDEGYGYWPPGPECPAVQSKTQCFPLNPEPTTEVCETGLGAIGTWINGVSVYNWGDGQSYNNERVWMNTAPNFEIYDLDICLGHAANG
ncbi:MAG: hypothetical protein AAF633_20045, partial [Chloroflexota bacterium]